MSGTVKQPLVVVAGPTASGKTALAVALCQQFDGEVISADSMQVYRELHIGTARPDEREQAGIPHHLMGTMSLGTSYSVARYATDARRAIAAVSERGRLPVLCGGTGLYIRAVTDNLSYADQPENRPVRDELRRRAETEGTAPLLRELTKIDSATAARLHPNDVGRIVRALELYYTTGRTITEQNEASHACPSPYTVCGLLLDFHDRDILYRRIERRVETMMAAGLENEARRLRACPEADTVKQAIGYKELWPYLEGRCTREEAVQALCADTRHYAKRQLSWFRHRPELKALYVDDYPSPEALVQAASARVAAQLEIKKGENNG